MSQARIDIATASYGKPVFPSGGDFAATLLSLLGDYSLFAGGGLQTGIVVGVFPLNDTMDDAIHVLSLSLSFSVVDVCSETSRRP
jgi:hypothetical protein